MGSRLACQGSGFLPGLSPVSLQRVSIHLDLKRNKELWFFVVVYCKQKTLITLPTQISIEVESIIICYVYFC